MFQVQVQIAFSLEPSLSQCSRIGCSLLYVQFYCANHNFYLSLPLECEIPYNFYESRNQMLYSKYLAHCLTNKGYSVDAFYSSLYP